jgi:adenine deaminase
VAADLLLHGGTVVDVVGKRCIAGDILIKDGRIHDVAPNLAAAQAATTLDVKGQFILPGLIDPHLHIESSLLSPLEFSRAAVQHGTTAVFVDPHEIANVAGKDGIDLFLRHAEKAPLDIFIGVPSCVPATDFEDTGAAISLADIEGLLPHPRVYGLAEMMNFPGIIYDIGEARAKVESAYKLGKVVDGHAPGVSGQDLTTYVTNGHNDGTVRIMSDHESRTGEEALEKRQAGMTVAVRYGSATKDLDRILPFLVEQEVDLDGFMLCSDDLDAEELREHGHVDRIVRRARDILMQHGSLGLEQATIQAIAMATLHPGRYFSRFFRHQGYAEMGEVAVGKAANLAVVDSLENLNCSTVICRGEVVFANGKVKAQDAPRDYGSLLNRVSVAEPVSAADFRVPYDGVETKASARVIGAEDGSLTTENRLLSLPTQDGEILRDHSQDVVKIAVIERHQRTGLSAVGFVSGLGMCRGAVASTVGHDSHNLLVAGPDEHAMAVAANHLIEIGGGMAVVVGNEVTALPLPIGGLMSKESVDAVASQFGSLLAEAKRTGTTSKNIFLLLSFLALPVIPQLKITNRGLVDVDAFAPVPLLAD